jgi:ATP-dependent DNA helicase RecG
MSKTSIFISSVQKEFEAERLALCEYILADPLLGRFFEPFVFENLPASDQRADAIYLREIERCSIYLGLFGKSYGLINSEGISPTELEFDRASALHKTRFIFLTKHIASDRLPQQNALIEKAQSFLVRKKFETIDELKSAVYASLVQYLMEKEIIRMGPFDASIHPSATLADINERKVNDFVRVAQSKRGFALAESSSVEDVFTHLNLINGKRISNAAILLFGKDPQHFFINSEVRCAHFHGEIVEKPIPSYKVFKGDVFELVDHAVDFVLSKLDYSVGTRSLETSIPGKYEIPKEIISEAVVNAIAHRDYTQNGSIQIMLFRDRLEIINPGALPLGWSVEKLKRPHASVPFNPLLAEPMYLKGYIERLGTGTADMMRLAQLNNLREPIFEQNEDFTITIYRPSAYHVPTKHPPSTHQVPTKYPPSSVEVCNLLKVIEGEMSRTKMQDLLELRDKRNFRENYIEPALRDGLIRMKYPESPNHPRQRYLLTALGEEAKRQLGNWSDAV